MSLCANRAGLGRAFLQCHALLGLNLSTECEVVSTKCVASTGDVAVGGDPHRVNVQDGIGWYRHVGTLLHNEKVERIWEWVWERCASGRTTVAIGIGKNLARC